MIALNRLGFMVLLPSRLLNGPMAILREGVIKEIEQVWWTHVQDFVVNQFIANNNYYLNSVIIIVRQRIHHGTVCAYSGTYSSWMWNMPPQGASSQEKSFWIGRGKAVEISTRNAREKIVPLDSARENESARSRDAILEAALRLFSRQGCRRTSLKEIAIEAGVSAGNVYSQFPMKDALLRSLRDHYGEVVGDPESLLGKGLVQGQGEPA